MCSKSEGIADMAAGLLVLRVIVLKPVCFLASFMADVGLVVADETLCGLLSAVTLFLLVDLCNGSCLVNCSERGLTFASKFELKGVCFLYKVCKNLGKFLI